MAKKGIDQLVPDLKNTLALASRNAAHKITLGVKEVGPYWTGQFEENWIIETGQVVIPPQLPDKSIINKNGAIEYKGVEYREPGEKQITEPFVPPPNGLKGYTIGNVMEYAPEACDLKPGVRTGNFAQQTAREDWFVSYIKGGEMQKDLGLAVDQMMKLGGFK